MAYTPAPQPGRTTGANSSPVVLASDTPVAIDDTANGLLAQILVALQAIAGAKGVLADMRVTPTGAVTVAQATAASLNATVAQATAANLNANIGQMNAAGALGFSMNNAVPNWTNEVVVNSFQRNMVR